MSASATCPGALLRRAALLAAAMATMSHALAVRANTVYIVDDIAVGLHTERQADSAVVGLVRSGTELEVLERDGNLLRVRTADGKEGWIDGNYLTAEAPARAQLLAAAATNEALHAELSALRRETERMKSDLLDSEESRKRQIANLSRALEGQLAAAREELETLREAKLEIADEADADRSAELAELARLKAENDTLKREQAEGDGARIPSATLRELQRLAEENQTLKSSLAEARAGVVAHRPVETDPAATSQDSTSTGASAGHFEALFTMTPYARWLLGWSALLLVGLGAYVQDYLIRRRHGGYRL